MAAGECIVRNVQPPPPVLPEPPEHLRALDPERYREIVEMSLEDHPGDALKAAFMVWRTWQFEAQRWQAEHGVVRGVKGWQLQLGPGRPPEAWVCNEYGLTGDAPESPCRPDCRTHAYYGYLREAKRQLWKQEGS